MTPALLRKQFTVAAYHQLYVSAILGEADRVELLDGAIDQISPPGPLHILLINRLTKLLIHLVGWLHHADRKRPDFGLFAVHERNHRARAELHAGLVEVEGTLQAESVIAHRVVARAG